jgi:WD40 repeat protein
LWDASQGTAAGVLGQASGVIVAVAVNPTEPLAAIGSDRPSEPGQALQVYNLASGQLVREDWASGHRLPTPRGSARHTPAAWSLAFSPDGDTLAVGLNNGLVSLRRVSRRGERQLKHSVGVRALAFSPDGRTLVTSPGTPAEIWDLETDTVRVRVGDIKFPIESLAFNPDGRTLLTGCWDSTVRVWDVATGWEQGRYDWNLGRINAVACAPDGMTGAAGGDNGDIILWDIDL